MPNNETPNTLIHFSDFFTESDKYMAKRIENAFKTGGLTGFWEKFFFCNDNHPDCKKFFYVFTEQQLIYLKKWWDDKISESEQIKENLEMSVQNCFSRIRYTSNGNLLNLRTFLIKQDPSSKSKISFILKLVGVIFKLPENIEKRNPNSPNFFYEKWVLQGKIAETPDERKIFLEELLFTTLKNRAAIEVFGKLKSGNFNLLYFGSDCGYYPDFITYCDKLNTDCPFYDTTNSTMPSGS